MTHAQREAEAVQGGVDQRTSRSSSGRKGLLIALAAVLTISPDSALCRLAAHDTSPESTTFFKYIAGFCTQTVAVLVLVGGPRACIAKARAGGKYFVAGVLLTTCVSLTLTRAFVTTSAASTLT